MNEHNSVDTRAIELATQALANAGAVASRLNAHEDGCSRRYQEAAAAAKEMRDDMRLIRQDLLAQTANTQAALGRIHGRLDKIMWSVLGGALLIVAYLLVNGTPYLLSK